MVRSAVQHANERYHFPVHFASFKSGSGLSVNNCSAIAESVVDQDQTKKVSLDQKRRQVVDVVGEGYVRRSRDDPREATSWGRDATMIVTPRDSMNEGGLVVDP